MSLEGGFGQKTQAGPFGNLDVLAEARNGSKSPRLKFLVLEKL